MYTKNFIDCWVYLNPEEKGFTYDIDKNTIANLNIKKRNNRILTYKKFTKQNLNFIPTNIKIFGEKEFPIENGNKLIHFSDQFGLYANFSIPINQIKN